MAASKPRLRRLLSGLAALLALGLGYAWAVARLGVGIPCPVHTLTGLLCPGCGVTRLCLALFRGDWAGAWAANPALCLALPALLGLSAWRAVGYVKGAAPSRWENRAWLALALFLLAFGVARNL